MSLIFRFLSIFILLLASLNGAELRGICDDIEGIKERLSQLGAVYLWDYAFIDHIYLNSDHSNLNEEFVRIREYQSSCKLCHKLRDLEGGDHQFLIDEEFNSLEEAKLRIPKGFYEGFSFSRHGSQYNFGNLHVHVEAIDGMPFSIEVLGPNKSEILELFKTLRIERILTDSVPSIIQKNIVQ